MPMPTGCTPGSTRSLRAPDTVFVVHGEPEASAALAERLADDDVNAVVPTQFEVVRLG